MSSAAGRPAPSRVGAAATATFPLPPRRSCLSVPASSERKLGKAAGIQVDELVLDLEDAVAPAAKDEARGLVRQFLLAGQWRCSTVAVRINPPGTPWCHEDVLVLASLPEAPFSLVVPKVEGRGDLEFVARLIEAAERTRQASPLRLQALIETPKGLLRADEIAASSARLDSLILGYADLAASLGRSRRAAAEPRLWLGAQEQLLLAARANGLQAVDGPHLGIEVDDSFRESAEHAAGLGFDGKWAIHPTQVAKLTEIFTPSPAEVGHAEAVIAALEDAERQGDVGAVALDGEMLDEAVRAIALRVIARAGLDLAG